MKHKFKILTPEFKKDSYKFKLKKLNWVYRKGHLSPICEFTDFEYNYKFLKMVYFLQTQNKKKFPTSNQNT